MFRNTFKYVNLPIFIGSWLGFAVFGMLLMPRMQSDSLGFYACLVATIVCFLLFGWQCLKANFQLQKDAARGAELREKEEQERKKTS